MMNLKNFEKIFFPAAIFFFLSFTQVFADATVSITNFYNLTTGETCQVAAPTDSCQQFMSDWHNWIGVPGFPLTQNNLSAGGGVSYTQGGWNQAGTVSTQTDFVSSYVQSALAVGWIPNDLNASSATYVCRGPTGRVTMRSVTPSLNAGTKAAFNPLDVTGMDCTVTLNFNEVSPTSGDGGDGGAGGYACQSNSCTITPGGPFSEPTCGGFCAVDFNNSSSITVSANPISRTVDYGVATTSYYDITVTKSGNFGANIVPNCEVFSVPGAGGGECAFVNASGNLYNFYVWNNGVQTVQTSSWTRYPQYYMDASVNSVTLRLAVRNYDQYGGVSSVKTHTIAVEAALIKESGPSELALVCNGSCTVKQDINLIVQNPAVCQPTLSVNGTSPAAADRTFVLSWSAVTDAVNYTVTVRDQTSCVTSGCGPIVYTGTVAGTSVTVPFGGDVEGVINKRFGYTISTNYSPARNNCFNIGSVLVASPTGGVPPGGGGPVGPTGSVNLTCNGFQNVTISSGGSCNLAWTSTDVVAGTCTASGNWSGSKANSGSEVRSNITQNSTYTITCEDSSGYDVSSTATVNIAGAPTADLKCNGADACTATRFTSTPLLSWGCTNSVSGSVSPGGYTGSPNGSANIGPFSSGSSAVYNLTCTSSTGATATDSVTVNIVDQPPAGTYSYTVSPASLSFAKPRTSGAWGGQLLVTNTGDQLLDVSYVRANINSSSGGGGWISNFNPVSNCPTLFFGGGSGSTCLINVSGITDGLSDGFHTFDAVFTGQNVPPANNKTVPVSLEITGPVTCPSPAASVILSSGTVEVGSSVTASAPSDFSNCTYSSSNPGVASVTWGTGTVNGVSTGNSNITALCTYQGAVNCNLAAATLNVIDPTGPSGSTYSFTVAPTSLSFNATQNGATPASKTVTVTADASNAGPLNITRTQNMTSGALTWGSADSPSFSLAAGASRVVTVSINTTASDPGNYDGTVTFTDANAGSKQVPVAYVLAPSSSTRTINVNSNWCGTVTSSPAGISCGATCNGNFDYNDTVTLTANPNTQCLFIGWLGDCAGQDATCDLTMTSDRTATPIFGLKPFDYEEF